MDLMIMVFIGVMCAYVAANIFSSKERNKVFNKRPIEVEDVKKYNRFCGILVLGFGIAAVLSIALMSSAGEIVSLFFPVAVIIEAAIILIIYSKNEMKFIKKR